MCSWWVETSGTSTINHTGVRRLERRQPFPIVRNHGWGHLSHGGQGGSWSDADGDQGVWEGSCREGRVAWLKPEGLQLPQCPRQLSLKSWEWCLWLFRGLDVPIIFWDIFTILVTPWFWNPFFPLALTFCKWFVSIEYKGWLFFFNISLISWTKHSVRFFSLCLNGWHSFCF